MPNDWSPDGRWLAYSESDPLNSSSGLRFLPLAGEATPLFDLETNQLGAAFPYDVSPDGQRFVVLRERGAAVSPALTVLVNWPASLQAPQAATP